MKMALDQDPQAIGYLGIGFVDQKVKGIKLDGVEPTQESVKSGVYAVTRLLYMNTKGEPQPLVNAFIDFLLGGSSGAWQCRVKFAWNLLGIHDLLRFVER
jgi:phosphate transport system substrate-binding protein